MAQLIRTDSDDTFRQVSAYRHGGEHKALGGLEEGVVGRLADRVLGSPEIYGHEEREAEQSVNFVTCHDGFTLHGVTLHQPDWRACSHSIALTAAIGQKQMRIHLILNAYWEPLDFELPPRDQGGAHAWRRWIDTALDTPHDIVPWQTPRRCPARPIGWRRVLWWRCSLADMRGERCADNQQL